ncbi:unnamed protein product [Onchocerca flexuosa]|uniref:Uncharacterized protein n=1 Tax=Onchocerca flexuosa TaxID=387005 RepID=A0A183I2L2_9BILA|nr:unnamed protein product [Onchocerca flexuosa]
MSTKHLRRYLQEKKAIEEKKSSVREEEQSSESASESGAFVCNKYEFLEESAEGGDESSGLVEEPPVEKKSEKKEKKMVKKKRKGKKKERYTDIDNDLDILDTSPQETQLSKLHDMIFERDLFKIDSRMLNVENELRSILGRRSIDATQRGRVVFGKIVKKKPTWPEIKNVGKIFFIWE